ncbi:MAG: ABC transporter ATP-binding protein [Burkholderiaceae bacterium]
MKVVECHGLGKTYGGIVALDNLSLSLEAGEPVALVGPNGAGKTTLFSLLCGFIQTYSGQVSVLGHHPGSAALSGRISALPQDAQFDPNFSISSQLRFFARLQGMSGRVADTDVERVLGLVQLTDSAAVSTRQLSHGMRKRASLAQALLGKPELILLDEPTAGIDPPNVKIIRDLIRTQTHQTTFLISSHNLDELEKLCTSVIYLNKGKLEHVGKIDEPHTNGFLTLSAPSIPEAEFIQACAILPGVISVRRQPQGEFVIVSETGAPTDQALLALLSQQGWRYRHLINGRTLENQLYGESN